MNTITCLSLSLKRAVRKARVGAFLALVLMLAEGINQAQATEAACAVAAWVDELSRMRELDAKRTMVLELQGTGKPVVIVDAQGRRVWGYPSYDDDKKAFAIGHYDGRSLRTTLVKPEDLAQVLDMEAYAKQQFQNAGERSVTVRLKGPGGDIALTGRFSQIAADGRPIMNVNGASVPFNWNDIVAVDVARQQLQQVEHSLYQMARRAKAGGDDNWAHVRLESGESFDARITGGDMVIDGQIMFTARKPNDEVVNLGSRTVHSVDAIPARQMRKSKPSAVAKAAPATPKPEVKLVVESELAIAEGYSKLDSKVAADYLRTQVPESKNLVIYYRGTNDRIESVSGDLGHMTPDGKEVWLTQGAKGIWHNVGVDRIVAIAEPQSGVPQGLVVRDRRVAVTVKADGKVNTYVTGDEISYLDAETGIRVRGVVKIDRTQPEGRQLRVTTEEVVSTRSGETTRAGNGVAQSRDAHGRIHLEQDRILTDAELLSSRPMEKSRVVPASENQMPNSAEVHGEIDGARRALPRSGLDQPLRSLSLENVKTGQVVKFTFHGQNFVVVANKISIKGNGGKIVIGKLTFPNGEMADFSVDIEKLAKELGVPEDLLAKRSLDELVFFDVGSKNRTFDEDMLKQIRDLISCKRTSS